MKELFERLGDTEFANDFAIFMSGKGREGVDPSEISTILA